MYEWSDKAQHTVPIFDSHMYCLARSRFCPVGRSPIVHAHLIFLFGIFGNLIFYQRQSPALSLHTYHSPIGKNYRQSRNLVPVLSWPLSSFQIKT